MSSVVSADRRRLTVSRVDEEASGRPRSGVEELQQDVKTKLEELLCMKRVADGTEVIIDASNLDGDGKRRASFKDKDAEKEAAYNFSGQKLVNATVNKDAKSNANQKGVVYACKKGMKPESPNQDSFSLIMVDGKFRLYGVYDGHGPDGHFVSNIANKFLVKEFLSAMVDGKSAEEAFNISFEACHANFDNMVDAGGQKKKTAEFDPKMSGTTCTMAYHDLETGMITISYVGDSRAMLGRRALLPKKADKYCLFETKDHKPDQEGEKKAIEKAGGRVIFDGYFNHRVFAKAGMYPGLNMSRALGDVVGHREAGLRATPDVVKIDLNRRTISISSPNERGSMDDSFAYDDDEELILLLCTDGVWEFLEAEDALKEMSKTDKKEVNAQFQALCQMSYDKWMEDSDGEISDDITGIAVLIPPK